MAKDAIVLPYFLIFFMINIPFIVPNKLNNITIMIILSLPDVKKYENIGGPKVDPKFPNWATAPFAFVCSSVVSEIFGINENTDP